jgi:hypothetical protein
VAFWRQFVILIVAFVVLAIFISPTVTLPRTALRSARQANAVFQSMASAVAAKTFSAVIECPTRQLVALHRLELVASFSVTPDYRAPLLC